MWKRTEHPKEIRINTRDLTLGMYVSRLDRSSLGLPFAFKGLSLQAPEDIAQLQRHCDHVFIDTEKSDRYAFRRLSTSTEE